MLSLKRAVVEDDWGTILKGCAGEGEGVLQNVESHLHAAEPPHVTWERTSVAPSWLKGVLGKRRDFLYVRSERFPRHTLAVNARDFGRDLDVSWYLVLEPVISTIVLVLGALAIPFLAFRISLQSGLIALFVVVVGLAYLRFRRGRQLDLFDQQDLRAYKTVAHHAVLEATKRLMATHGLDATRLRRESRGRFPVAE